MTVSIPPKSDISKTDTNDNETCCTNKNVSSTNHTESLLDTTMYDFDNEEKTKEAKPELDNKIEKQNQCSTTMMRLYNLNEAPKHLQHNIFILTGYRGILNTKLCIESIFWWTNETMNIWSHIFGFLLFVGLTIYDLLLLKLHASFLDKLCVAMLLLCFQACMALSAIYHTFSCRSEHDCDYFLSLDLFGIALTLLAIYMSGIYYAFWCHQGLLSFYMITITVIFGFAMILQYPKLNINANLKMIVFVIWAAYGVVPTLHWAILMGGFGNPLVATLIPRVAGMYAISGAAFLIYLTKVPERFCAGKFDYLGHSHQWWHIFVVFALYYWHNTGIMYAEYRMNHACATMLRLDF